MIEKRQKEFGPSGFQAVLVIGDGSAGPATSSLCKQLKSKYTAPVIVLYDPTQTFKTHFGQAGPNEINVILRGGGLVEYVKRYASQTEVEAKIKSVLGIP